MSDLGERLQRLLAPQTPDAELDKYEQLIARKYQKAYEAFYQKRNRTKCGAKLLDIRTAVKEEARTDGIWLSYILCKAFLLGALFEARPKALDDLDMVSRNLLTFTPDGAKSGSFHFEEDLSDMSDLRDQLQGRLKREDPRYLKETWFPHRTTTWPIRMTDEWLEQTSLTAEK